ncbi:hypothetical protein [Streptomyces sp. NPDC003697]
MPTRTLAVTAAGVGTAVLAATGITHAATSQSAPASPSVHHPAAAVHRAAQPDRRAAPAAAPASVVSASEEKGEGRDRDDGGHDYGRQDEGWIQFNERSYSASTEGCITAASGLGSSSFNVFNDSRRTIEVFRGFTCDNGAPVATVGPHGETNGVVTPTVQGGLFGLFGDDGVVGSFRVLHDHDEW